MICFFDNSLKFISLLCLAVLFLFSPASASGTGVPTLNESDFSQFSGILPNGQFAFAIQVTASANPDFEIIGITPGMIITGVFISSHSRGLFETHGPEEMIAALSSLKRGDKIRVDVIDGETGEKAEVLYEIPTLKEVAAMKRSGEATSGASSEVKFEIDTLRKALSSGKIEVFLFDAARLSCNKIVHENSGSPGGRDSLIGYSEFRILSRDLIGKIFDNGYIEVPWKMDFGDRRLGKALAEECKEPTSGTLPTVMKKVFETENHFPYAWQTVTEERYCLKWVLSSQIFRGCTKQCLHSVSKGAAAHAFVLTKEFSEEISDVKCD